ncbi:MAG: acyl-CoA thioesterase [Planctomycetes bacterium]|nr:acyl-CoA thioesterase [Planctomycetota bacterium]
MPESKEHLTEITVRLSETDEFGVVWHGNYPLYFEVARNEMARAFGLTAKELKALGVFPPVVDFAVQCRLPAKNDDVLVVACSIDPLESASITVRYRITRKSSGEVIATGHSRQVIVNEKGFLQYQLPDTIKGKVEAMAETYRGPATPPRPSPPAASQ